MTLQNIYENRTQAGRILSDIITREKIKADIIVALPRGGVPLGVFMANELGIPLKLLMIRKIGHPINPEFAIGAVSETDLYLNEGNQYGHEYLKESIKNERNRIETMKKHFGRELTKAEVQDKQILLVDDGIATGTCMMLAIREIYGLGAKNITVATPVCPYNTANKIRKEKARLVCPLTPMGFLGIGAYYQQFDQLTDDQVIKLLERNSL